MKSDNPSPHASGLRARAMFEEGHACSQAVLGTFADIHGLDATLALKIAVPFGGGIGCLGGQCGAVSGALMALGLHGGCVDPADEAGRKKTDALVVEFMTRFEEEFGSLECNTLTGLDMRDPEARAAGKERGVFAGTCPTLVQKAAEMVAEIMVRLAP